MKKAERMILSSNCGLIWEYDDGGVFVINREGLITYPVEEIPQEIRECLDRSADLTVGDIVKNNTKER